MKTIPRMQRVVCGYIEKAKEEFPEIQTRIYCCGEDFLQVKERYDILILDIDLPGISGIELGHRLRKNGDDTAVVFLTAYPQYAAESYVIEAWQYVLKEQMEERFPEILHRLISSLLEEKKDLPGSWETAVEKRSFIQRYPLYTERQKRRKVRRVCDGRKDLQGKDIDRQTVGRNRR
mgnify:CR=1 FL=1